MNRGKLFLIPSPLGEYDPAEVIPEGTLKVLRELKIFVVEEVRTARRYLSAAGLKGHIQELEFYVLNEHTCADEIRQLPALFEKGDVGLISEAGLPAVADPGAALVDLCHREGIQVIPLAGPSSLMLALMASGLNGQSFAFRGYLPTKPEERKAAIRRLEKDSAALRQTQIIIETPYRNDTLLKDLAEQLNPHTRICAAAALTTPEAFVRCQSAQQWRKDPVLIGKIPCVFLILAQ